MQTPTNEKVGKCKPDIVEKLIERFRQNKEKKENEDNQVEFNCYKEYYPRRQYEEKMPVRNLKQYWKKKYQERRANKKKN